MFRFDLLLLRLRSWRARNLIFLFLERRFSKSVSKSYWTKIRTFPSRVENSRKFRFKNTEVKLASNSRNKSERSQSQKCQSTRGEDNSPLCVPNKMEKYRGWKRKKEEKERKNERERERERKEERKKEKERREKERVDRRGASSRLTNPRLDREDLARLRRADKSDSGW